VVAIFRVLNRFGGRAPLARRLKSIPFGSAMSFSTKRARSLRISASVDLSNGSFSFAITGNLNSARAARPATPNVSATTPGCVVRPRLALFPESARAARPATPNVSATTPGCVVRPRLALFPESARAARPATSNVSATTPGCVVRPGRALFPERPIIRHFQVLLGELSDRASSGSRATFQRGTRQRQACEPRSELDHCTSRRPRKSHEQVSRQLRGNSRVA